MNHTKYIGIDVHSAAISIMVLNGAGKLIMEATLETRTAAMAGFIRGLEGTLHVTFEEGVHAGWLDGLLRPQGGPGHRLRSPATAAPQGGKK